MFNDGELELVYPPPLLALLVMSISYTPDDLQFGVQTANQSIVCSCMNASFDVDIEYLNGVQTISQRNTEIMSVNDNIYSDRQLYTNIFSTITGSLIGNLTVAGPYLPSKGEGPFWRFALTSVNTGLITCNEIFRWMNPNNYNNALFGGNDSVPFTAADIGIPAEYSKCRNRSLSLAIQDLASNITIGLLSISDTTVNVSTPVSITTPRSIYQYDSRNLIISYATGIAATTFAVVVGLMAIHSNGVSHSTSFIAIMRSTIGNRQMSELSKGQSLGAEPLSDTVAEKKSRLGVIKEAEDEADRDDWGDSAKCTGFGMDGTVTINRVGFGLDGTVTKQLRKGQKFLC